MINIFKKIKQILMTKQELEQQLAEAIAVAQRLNAENQHLRQENSDLVVLNNGLSGDLNQAIERVRHLANQVNMMESQNKAKTQYSDSDRNY
jgi:uncharacterized pyridoxal phosphate-containing UPF0001 family protein